MSHNPRLRFRVVQTKALLTTEKQTITHLCTLAFERSVAGLFALVPETAHHVLVYRQKILVGHVTWMTRWLQVGSAPLLRTAYVDAVAVHPTYQGQGIGSRMMDYLAEQIQDYEIGALSTSRVNFYRRLNWEVWQGVFLVRMETGLEISPLKNSADRVMVLRLPQTPVNLNLTMPLSINWRRGSIW